MKRLGLGRGLPRPHSDEDDHPTKGKRSIKTRKTRTGLRTIPLPEPLLALGFATYVKWLQDAGERALFPALTTKGSRGLSANFSDWWSKYLRHHGAFPAGQGRRALREFRQSWASAAIASGLTDEERKYLMGHAIDARTASGHYGNLRPLGEAIHRLQYRGLALDGVRPWEAPA